MLRRLSRATVILVPLLTCIFRFQARALANPDDIVKELARCFSLVRIGVARRTGGRRTATDRTIAVAGDPPSH